MIGYGLPVTLYRVKVPVEPGGLSPILKITASGGQAEQVPAKLQHCRGWPVATQEVIAHRHRCFKVPLDVKIIANIGLAEKEIGRAISQHGPQRMGRPLAPVPKADSEVARVVILQEQLQNGQHFSRRIVRYVSLLRHPAGPTARSHGDQPRKQDERSSFVRLPRTSRDLRQAII